MRGAFDAPDVSIAERKIEALRTDCARKWVGLRFLPTALPNWRCSVVSGTRTRTAPLIPTGTWRIDAAHSSVRFSVKHMGIANVRGKFSEFEGTLEMKERLADCRAFGTVKVACWKMPVESVIRTR